MEDEFADFEEGLFEDELIEEKFIGGESNADF